MIQDEKSNGNKIKGPPGSEWISKITQAYVWHTMQCTKVVGKVAEVGK